MESTGHGHDSDPHEARTNMHTRWPSLDEMIETLRQAGIGATSDDQTLLRDLASPDNWKQNKDGREKLDYERLSEKHGQTVDAMYQRMSRLSGRAKRRFTSLGVFVDVASKTLAHIKNLAMNLFRFRFVCLTIACLVGLAVLSMELLPGGTKNSGPADPGAEAMQNAVAGETVDLSRSNQPDQAAASLLISTAGGQPDVAGRGSSSIPGNQVLHYSDLHLNPQIKGVPSAVVVVYGELDDTRREKLSSLFATTIGKFGEYYFVRRSNEDKEPRGVIAYVGADSKDMSECASFTQFQLNDVEPGWGSSLHMIELPADQRPPMPAREDGKTAIWVVDSIQAGTNAGSMGGIRVNYRLEQTGSAIPSGTPRDIYPTVNHPREGVGDGNRTVWVFLP